MLKNKKHYINEIGKTVMLNCPYDLGIGNRIKSIASRFYYFKTDSMFLNWPSKGWVTAKFSDLFSLENYNVVETNNTYMPPPSRFFYGKI